MTLSHSAKRNLVQQIAGTIKSIQYNYQFISKNTEDGCCGALHSESRLKKDSSDTRAQNAYFTFIFPPCCGWGLFTGKFSKSQR